MQRRSFIQSLLAIPVVAVIAKRLPDKTKRPTSISVVQRGWQAAQVARAQRVTMIGTDHFNNPVSETIDIELGQRVVFSGVKNVSSIIL